MHMISLTNRKQPIPGICRHFKHSPASLPILQQPICSIPLGTWVPKIGESNGRPFAMLRPNASLSDALSLLVQGAFVAHLEIKVYQIILSFSVLFSFLHRFLISYHS